MIMKVILENSRVTGNESPPERRWRAMPIASGCLFCLETGGTAWRGQERYTLARASRGEPCVDCFGARSHRFKARHCAMASRPGAARAHGNLRRVLRVLDSDPRFDEGYLRRSSDQRRR